MKKKKILFSRNEKTKFLPSARFLLIALAVILIVLAWAPWLDNKNIHDRVFERRARIDGTIDKNTGEVICDYNVTWFPFGRWVASCEGGYFVTFWNKIIY